MSSPLKRKKRDCRGNRARRMDAPEPIQGRYFLQAGMDIAIGGEDRIIERVTDATHITFARRVVYRTTDIGGMKIPKTKRKRRLFFRGIAP